MIELIVLSFLTWFVCSATIVCLVPILVNWICAQIACLMLLLKLLIQQFILTGLIMTPTALQIIREYLIDNNFDGLVKPVSFGEDPATHYECGCQSNDLQPCGSDFSQCKPGHKYKDPDNEFEFLIFEEPQEGMERIK